MARKWRDARADAEKAGLIDEQQVKNARKEMIEEIRAYRLGEIRKAQPVSQYVLAERMGVRQPRVSANERGSLTSTELGTLEAYVEALGGHLRVVADFGDESLTVRD